MMSLKTGFERIYILCDDTTACQTLCEQLAGYANLTRAHSLKGIRKTDKRILVLASIGTLSLKDISELTKKVPEAVVAFVLVEDTAAILPYLCVAGVNGLFFRGEREEILHKGIHFLDEGELFFPRNLLPQLVNHIKLDADHSADQLQRLSSKEQEILHLLSEGSSNRDIADRLNVSFHTVKTHVYNIYKKLEVKNRAEAIRMAKSALV